MLGNVKVLCSVTPLATRLSHSSAAFTEIHYRMTYSSSSCYGNIYKVTSSCRPRWMIDFLQIWYQSSFYTILVSRKQLVSINYEIIIFNLKTSDRKCFFVQFVYKLMIKVKPYCCNLSHSATPFIFRGAIICSEHRKEVFSSPINVKSLARPHLIRIICLLKDCRKLHIANLTFMHSSIKDD